MSSLEALIIWIRVKKKAKFFDKSKDVKQNKYSLFREDTDLRPRAVDSYNKQSQNYFFLQKLNLTSLGMSEVDTV